jgi:PAS domain S-box-containing protein
MPSPHHARLSVTVSAVRDLMEQILASHAVEKGRSADPHILEALRIGMEALDALWEELEGQSECVAREKKRYLEFFNSASDAYLVTESNGTIREANRKAAELLGAPAPELRDKPLAAFVPPEEQVNLMLRLARLRANVELGTDAWRGAICAGQGATRGVDFNVRASSRPSSGGACFCWLLRPAARDSL